MQYLAQYLWHPVSHITIFASKTFTTLLHVAKHTAPTEAFQQPTYASAQSHTQLMSYCIIFWQPHKPNLPFKHEHKCRNHQVRKCASAAPIPITNMFVKSIKCQTTAAWLLPLQAWNLHTWNILAAQKLHMKALHWSLWKRWESTHCSTFNDRPMWCMMAHDGSLHLHSRNSNLQEN